MAMLLDARSETRHQITETVLLAVVRNDIQPLELLQMLLVDRANELDFPNGKVTSVLLEAAVQERGHGLHIVTFLLDLDADDTHMTEAVITSAMDNYSLRDQLIPLLCWHSSKARNLYLSIIASRQDDIDEHFTADLVDAFDPDSNMKHSYQNFQRFQASLLPKYEPE